MQVGMLRKAYGCVFTSSFKLQWIQVMIARKLTTTVQTHMLSQLHRELSLTHGQGGEATITFEHMFAGLNAKP